MMLTYLLSFLLAASPADDAAVALALAKAKREREVVPVVKVVRQQKAATHSHRCPRCGNIWAHADDSFGKASDHLCPSCGYGPVWQVYQRFR